MRGFGAHAIGQLSDHHGLTRWICLLCSRTQSPRRSRHSRACCRTTSATAGERTLRGGRGACGMSPGVINLLRRLRQRGAVIAAAAVAWQQAARGCRCAPTWLVYQYEMALQHHSCSKDRRDVACSMALPHSHSHDSQAAVSFWPSSACSKHPDTDRGVKDALWCWQSSLRMFGSCHVMSKRFGV